MILLDLYKSGMVLLKCLVSSVKVLFFPVSSVPIYLSFCILNNPLNHNHKVNILSARGSKRPGHLTFLFEKFSLLFIAVLPHALLAKFGHQKNN